jgi:pimeloyl-ACP methyl ester carboxylesterase
VEPFPTDADNWRLAWWGMVGDVDPVAMLDRSRVPTLFVYGSEDQHDNVPVAESVGRLDSLRRARSDRVLDVQVFPGMGHTLVSPASGWVSSEVLEVILGWLKSRAMHRPRREPLAVPVDGSAGEAEPGSGRLP